jgi:hypothetical protein
MKLFLSMMKVKFLKTKFGQTVLSKPI